MSDTPRVLVADDERLNQLVTGKVVESAGATCDFAGSGEQAVTSVATETYDLVLMDLQMPGIGGLEAIKQMRAAGYPGMIVAVTGFDDEKTHAEARDAGADEVRTKPVSAAVVRNLVAAAAAR